MDVCAVNPVETDAPIVSFEVLLDALDSTIHVPATESMFLYPSLGIASVWCIDALTTMGRKGKEVFDITSVFNGQMPVYFERLFEEQDTAVQVEPISTTLTDQAINDLPRSEEIDLIAEDAESDSESEMDLGEPYYD